MELELFIRWHFVIDKIMLCDYNFRGAGWNHVSEEAKYFVSSLIKFDPIDRWTTAQALESDFLSENTVLSEKSPDGGLLQAAKYSMESYLSDRDLKKLALLVIAHQSSTSEVAALKRIFTKSDKNNDGSLTLSELHEALSFMNITEDELTSIFKGLDVDQSGKISYTEFLAATIETQGKVDEGKLANAFNQIDKDGTGYISRKNLRDIMGSQYTEAKADQMFADVDKDNNGKITFKDFVSIFREGFIFEAEKLPQSDLMNHLDKNKANNFLEDDGTFFTSDTNVRSVDVNHRLPLESLNAS